jgi:predicted acylesterase/phospholipase RssA/CRP-like cAMP-binding protein
VSASRGEFLASTDLFQDVDAAALESLCAAFEPVSLTGGETLFRQGEAGESLFLVVSGRLRATMGAGEDGASLQGEIGPREVVGEIALMTREARTATVRAVRDSELLKLSHADFDRLVESHPSLMMRLARKIVQRHRDAVRGAGRRSRPAATIAILPAGSGHVPEGFTERLHEALGAYGNVCVLDSSSASSIPTERLVEWLNAQEAEYRFVLYKADRTFTPWTARCLRQADRLLFVAAPGAAVDPGYIETTVSFEGEPGHAAARELVLLHDGSSPAPMPAAAWLQPRAVERHHHVWLDRPADFHRLARFLAGKAVGLVLGGGGARGLAHIGLLRALDEAKVDVDLIGGTSMGAFISALRAWGMDWKEMLAFNRRCWIEASPLHDYTLPMLSALSGQRFLKSMRAFFGETAIEDLPLSYFCMTSNLSMARPSEHRNGPLWLWMCTSMAIPGVAPPTLDAGHLFVDGGVLENVPIATMRRRHDGPIIAHDVTPRMDLCVGDGVSEIPSSWRMLWDRLNPYHRGPLFPGIFDVLSRVTALGSIRSVERTKSEASLYLHSPVEGNGIFDFDKMDALVDIGYRHAAEKLAGWSDSKARA